MDVNLNATMIAGNEAWRILAFFLAMTAGLVAGKVGRSMLARSALLVSRHGRAVFASLLVSLSRSTSFLAVAAAFPIAMAFLTFGENVRAIIDPIQAVLITVAVGYTFYHLADVAYTAMKRHAASTENKMDDMLVPIVRTSLRVTVVVLTLLQVAQSLTDKPLTSIIAGLGVGGLAVALAAQETIKHFFGSVVLFADKPFQVGERIVIDSVDGVVEEVGFRSTRIRTLEGHLVTMPNGDLANKTITNIGQRPYIRHRAIINITYDTPPEKVRRALEILHELLDNHEGMNPEFPPRIFFDELASASLNLFVMFWYHPPDFWAFKAFTERLYFSILERFNAEGIDFAFPTQTLYLAGDEKRPLAADIRLPGSSGSTPA